MTIVQTSTGNKIFLTIVGIISTALGLFLFPKSIFQGFFEILPIFFSGLFIFFGFYAIYFALLYRLIIDENGISTGNSFYKNIIPNHKIKGFFTFEIQDKKDKILQLAILQHDGKSKVFTGNYSRENIHKIAAALAEKHTLVKGKDKTNFLIQRKNKKLRILSYVGIAIVILGLFLMYSFFKPEPKYINVHGTLLEQPDFNYNKRDRANRIKLKLNEYPGLIFSKVGSVGYLEEWADLTETGDKISIQISEKDYQTKIKKTSDPDPVILNYNTDMIEFKRLIHQKISSNEIYQENTAERLVLGIFFLLAGVGMFFYYQRDIRKVSL